VEQWVALKAEMEDIVREGDFEDYQKVANSPHLTLSFLCGICRLWQGP